MFSKAVNKLVEKTLDQNLNTYYLENIDNLDRKLFQHLT